jgi:hypothetical protein
VAALREYSGPNAFAIPGNHGKSLLLWELLPDGSWCKGSGFEGFPAWLDIKLDKGCRYWSLRLFTSGQQ